MTEGVYKKGLPLHNAKNNSKIILDVKLRNPSNLRTTVCQIPKRQSNFKNIVCHVKKNSSKQNSNFHPTEIYSMTKFDSDLNISDN